LPTRVWSGIWTALHTVFEHDDKIYSTKFCTWLMSTNSFTPLVNKNLESQSKIITRCVQSPNKVNSWTSSWCELCTCQKDSLPSICSHQEQKTACLVLYWGYEHFGECEPIPIVFETHHKIWLCFHKMMRTLVKHVHSISYIHKIFSLR
jgi:hypothetical protein